MKKKTKFTAGKKAFNAMKRKAEESFESTVGEKSGKCGMTAKKAFVIRQEPYLREIVAGDDLSDVPEKYHQNLRTEGVL